MRLLPRSFAIFTHGLPVGIDLIGIEGLRRKPLLHLPMEDKRVGIDLIGIEGLRPNGGEDVRLRHIQQVGIDLIGIEGLRPSWLLSP